MNTLPFFSHSDVFLKEKQAEAIVEKLCQRFRLTEDPRQWRDIAFCLSLLPFKSERSVKKLIDGLQFYRDKLHEPKVFEFFTEILQKVCVHIYGVCETRSRHKFFCYQARTNKSKDKPDSELDEFEKVNAYTFCDCPSYPLTILSARFRSWRNTNCKVKKTKHLKSASRVRKLLRRKGQPEKVKNFERKSLILR